MSDLFSRCGRGGGCVSVSLCITHGGWRGESSDRSHSDERCGGNRRSPCSAAGERRFSAVAVIGPDGTEHGAVVYLCDGIVVVFSE